MRVTAWWMRFGAAVAAVLLVTVPLVASASEGSPAAEAAPSAVEKPSVQMDAAKAAQDEACALLDDPAKVAVMDGLLVRLAIQCDRTEFLGQVRSEPSMDLGEEAGTDVRVNDPSADASGYTVQSETSLAVSETTGTICSAYNDFGGYFANNNIAGFSRSTDGGATFADRGGLSSGSFGDPAMVWRKADGYFYLATLGDTLLRVYRSTDDCQTFIQVGSVGSGIDDKELMAVDNSPASPYYGRMYLTWTDFSTGGAIRATYSSDGGVTWSSAVTLSTSTNAQGSWPAVAPNGTVYAGCVGGWLTGSITIEVKRSTDGGATWSAATSPASGKVEPRDATATNSCGRSALKGGVRYLPSPQLAVGPDDALHVVYSYDPDGYNTGDVVNVYYRKSTDAGSTWGTEVLLNDDGTTRDQYYPTLSVGPSNVVSAAWYDRRLDPNNLLVDYYQRFSFDGGATWEPSVRISDVSTPIYLETVGPVATCYHGDYDTQVQTESAALIQWADDRSLQYDHNDPDVYLDQQAVSTDFLVTAAPRRLAVCAPADGVYTVDVLQFQGFTEQVTLSANNVPAGATSTFTPNPVTPPGASQLTIGSTGALAFGTYDMTVVGTSSPSSFVHDTDVTLDVYTQAAGAVTLVAPANGSFNQPLRPSFEWTAATQAGAYHLQVATDAAFTDVVIDATAVAGTSFSPTLDLQSNTLYYWRARAVNVCGPSAWSSVFDFYTTALPGDCGIGTVAQEEFFDDFEAGAGLWTHSGTGDTWALWSSNVHSGSFAFHANDVTSVSDQRLVSPAVVLPAGASGLTLQFWNRQYIENSSSGCYDGGIAEISTDDGATWTQLPDAVLLTDPYDGVVSSSFSNPLAGLEAWCGEPQDWLRSVVDVDAHAGQTVRFRFRLGTDSSVGYEGWTIDDVKVQSCVAADNPVFADDFESGTTDAWSAVVP